jgi:hypothetical protein
MYGYFNLIDNNNIDGTSSKIPHPTQTLAFSSQEGVAKETTPTSLVFLKFVQVLEGAWDR